MGLTCLDHCQPGWNVARPTPPASTSTNSSWPMPSLNGRTSSGLLKLLTTKPAIMSPDHSDHTVHPVRCGLSHRSTVSAVVSMTLSEFVLPDGFSENPDRATGCTQKSDYVGDT